MKIQSRLHIKGQPPLFFNELKVRKLYIVEQADNIDYVGELCVKLMTVFSSKACLFLPRNSNNENFCPIFVPSDMWRFSLAPVGSIISLEQENGLCV